MEESEDQSDSQERQAEDQAAFRKIYQTTDHLATYRLNRNAMRGESKCGQRRSTSRRLSTPSLTILFGRNSKSCNVDHEYVSLLRKIYRDQKASVQTDEESEIFDIQKRIQARRSDVQPVVQHSASILITGRNTKMAKEKRNGNLVERPRPRLPHELAICRRRDAVCKLQRTAVENDV